MTAPNRRSFLAVAGAGLATTAGLVLLNQPWSPARSEAMPGRATYSGLIGAAFSIDGDPSLGVVLEAVTDLAGTPAGSDKAFALLFRSVGGAPLSSELHRFSHETTGTETFFASTVDRGAAMQHEVIINRHTPEELT